MVDLVNNIKSAIKKFDLNIKYYRNGEIIKIDKQTLVATRDKFLDLGVIDDGEKQYQFEDYARAKNLWGGYSRAKGLRLVASDIQKAILWKKR